MGSSDREILWSAWLNKLAYCYGCGKFGLPRGSPPIPRGWTVLYQPHPDGPSGLHVCSGACADRVRAAMAVGAVMEPLEIATDFGMMPADVRESWERHVRDASTEMLVDHVTASPDGGIPGCSQKEIAMEEEAPGVPVRLVPREHPTDKPLSEIPPRQRLGEALRRVRYEAGKVPAEAATVIGLNPCDLEEMEIGERQLSADQIRELLAYYGQSQRLDEFVVYAREWYEDLYRGDGGVVADGPPDVMMAGRTLGGRSPAELADLVVRYEAVLSEMRSSLADIHDETGSLLARIDEVLPSPDDFSGEGG